MHVLTRICLFYSLKFMFIRDHRKDLASKSCSQSNSSNLSPSCGIRAHSKISGKGKNLVSASSQQLNFFLAWSRNDFSKVRVILTLCDTMYCCFNFYVEEEYGKCWVWSSLIKWRNLSFLDEKTQNESSFIRCLHSRRLQHGWTYTLRHHKLGHFSIYDVLSSIFSFQC